MEQSDMSSYSVTTLNWNDAMFWSTVSAAGPGGGDLLDFSALPSNYSVDIHYSTGELTISDGTTTFTVGDLIAPGSYDAGLDGTTQFSYFDILHRTAGDDTVVGSFSGEEIHCEVGADDIQSKGGDDTVFGDAGDDDNDILQDNDGDDTLLGDAGDDTLNAGDGEDSLSGGDGADLLCGRAGDYTTTGGADADVITDFTLGEDFFAFRA